MNLVPSLLALALLSPAPVSNSDVPAQADVQALADGQGNAADPLDGPPRGTFQIRAGAWFHPPVWFDVSARLTIQEAIRTGGANRERLEPVFDMLANLTLNRGVSARGGKGGLGTYVLLRVPIHGGLGLSIRATESPRADAVFRALGSGGDEAPPPAE